MSQGLNIMNPSKVYPAYYGCVKGTERVECFTLNADMTPSKSGIKLRTAVEFRRPIARPGLVRRTLNWFSGE